MIYRIGLVLNTVLWAAIAMPSLGAALMSPMMFDAPGSQKNPILQVAFWSILTFPLALILAIVVSWVFWLRGNHQIGFWWSCLPYLNALVAAIALYFWK